ncbi:FadR/GntR family transcriptional regulator [Streptomyces sp. NPDC056983]|uniref:FadR/GntR family transcriptional regulator n=1 Tax=Streptomyces sp. NPDC056983 TaxID=3345987 RepID=UPI00362B7697
MVVKKVLAPKPYELLADQLREAILDGEIAEGDALPPERDLVDQTGLTRGSVREALKLLAAEGLVETRPGRFGGNIATLPARRDIASSLGQFVRSRQLPLRTLHETRDVLEPALARLAAAHRTNSDLVTLRRLHQELELAEGFQRFARTNVKWHRAIAQASGNELLTAALEAIAYGVAVSTTAETYDTPQTRTEVIRIHAHILAAIEARDGALAERRMRQHISATRAQSTDVEFTYVPMSPEE